jgi:hypothetical protein
MYKIPRGPRLKERDWHAARRLFGRSGYVTAVAAGQSQRFYSGAGFFSWYYPSFTPRDLCSRGAYLEYNSLEYHQYQL